MLSCSIVQLAKNSQLIVLFSEYYLFIGLLSSRSLLYKTEEKIMANPTLILMLYRFRTHSHMTILDKLVHPISTSTPYATQLYWLFHSIIIKLSGLTTHPPGFYIYTNTSTVSRKLVSSLRVPTLQLYYNLYPTDRSACHPAAQYMVRVWASIARNTLIYTILNLCKSAHSLRVANIDHTRELLQG